MADAVTRADWAGTWLIERAAPTRVRTRLVGQFRSVLYAGARVECPLCDGRFRTFKPDWNRPDAICPRCLSQERHRALWLYLREHDELLAGTRSLLHFAPEPGLEAHLRARPGLRYVTADIEPGQAMERADITALHYPDGSFDAVLCSHVLEHVEDDGRALRELRRVLAPGGWALLMVPADLTRATTYEDASITTPEGRERAFLQRDHVRLYGRDFPAIVAGEGFDVETLRFVAGLDPRTQRRHGLQPADEIYLAVKPGA
jgi:Methyltransferase domain